MLFQLQDGLGFEATNSKQLTCTRNPGLTSVKKLYTKKRQILN